VLARTRICEQANASQTTVIASRIRDLITRFFVTSIGVKAKSVRREVLAL
jgi:hypothetical protein